MFFVSIHIPLLLAFCYVVENNGFSRMGRHFWMRCSLTLTLIFSHVLFFPKRLAVNVLVLTWRTLTYIHFPTLEIRECNFSFSGHWIFPYDVHENGHFFTNVGPKWAEIRSNTVDWKRIQPLNGIGSRPWPSRLCSCPFINNQARSELIWSWAID